MPQTKTRLIELRLLRMKRADEAGVPILRAALHLQLLGSLHVFFSPIGERTGSRK
jgi:hypothetical protein